MTSQAISAYGQLFSVGVLWICIHCSGMCGPLVVALSVRNFKQVCAYQAGRMITYAWLGGVMGLLGDSLENYFARAGSIFALGFAAVLVFYLKPIWRRQLQDIVQVSSKRINWYDKSIMALQRYVISLGVSGGLLKTVYLGMLMGFLPCMITMWALGLAALSGSILHGALIMMCLVAMTTPMLSIASFVPTLVGKFGWQKGTAIAQPLLLGFSSVWLFLIGLSGLELIPHAHLNFLVMGKHYMIMFW